MLQQNSTARTILHLFLLAFLSTAVVGQPPHSDNGCRSWLWNATEYNAYSSNETICVSVGPWIDDDTSLVFCKDTITAPVGTGCLCTEHTDCDNDHTSPSASSCIYANNTNEDLVGRCTLRKNNEEACWNDHQCRSGRCCGATRTCCEIEDVPVISGEEQPLSARLVISVLAFSVVFAVVLVTFASMYNDESTAVSTTDTNRACGEICCLCSHSSGCGCDCQGCELADCTFLCCCPGG